MNARWLFTLAVGAVACAGGSKEPAAPTPPAATESDRFADASQAFLEAELAFRPHEAVALGHHEYDGALPERSEAAVEAEIARLEAAIQSISEIASDSLSAVERAERAAILARARRGLFELAVWRAPERDPISYVRALDLSYYADVPYAPAEARARAAARICDGAGDYLEAARARLTDDIPAPVLEAARAEARALAAYARNEVAPALAAGSDEAPVPELGESLKRCESALEAFSAALGERVEAAPESLSLGEEGLAAWLGAEGIALEVSAVRALAEGELAEASEALAQAAEQIDPGLPVAEVLEFERMNKPAGDELIPVAEQQVAEVRALAQDKGLAPISTDAEVKVSAAPRFRDRSAAVRAPGPGEREMLPAVFYLPPADPSWPEAEREAFALSIGDLLVASIREVWPGRLAHAHAAARSESDILASFCPATTRDGWAHYAEGAMWDAGLGDGEPRIHAALLASEIQRALRVLAVIDLHTGAITPSEAAERFEREAFLNAAAARNEAARALYEPSYAAEALGRLAIETLRRDWEAKRGAGDVRGFHDALLSQGCAPLPAIRDALLGPGAGPLFEEPAPNADRGEGDGEDQGEGEGA